MIQDVKISNRFKINSVVIYKR